MRELERLQAAVIRCKKCPRLVTYLEGISARRPRRYQEWNYWSKPLPSFGDPRARVLIIGLAPAAHGGNRTGRMFTGDRSGEWLFRALHEFGFANRPASSSCNDDFALTNCYITATLHCAPPQNKPLPQEIENCRSYLLQELDLLRNVRVIVPLGQIAFAQTLRSLRQKGVDVPALSFGHGKRYELQNGQILLTTYHPSQQNTQTGKLTKVMFHSVFRRIKASLDSWHV